MSGNISLNDLQRVVTVRCKNDNGSTLKVGACVRWTDDDTIKVKAFNGSCVDHFAGILNRTMVDDQEESTALVIEGKVQVRFLGNASAVANTWAIPVAGQSYLTYSAVPTGIRLLDDMSGDTDVHEAGESAGATVYVYPGALKNAVYWASPAVGDDDGILDGQTVPAEGDTYVPADFIGATGTLAVARNIVVTPKTNTGDVKAGDITVTGTNIDGDAITETLAIPLDNHAAAIVGLSAFKTVVSVAFPAQDGATATWDIGYREVLGLPRCQTGGVVNRPLQTLLNNVVEGTVPTIVADADEVEKNTIDLSTALSGVPVMVYFPYPL